MKTYLDYLQEDLENDSLPRNTDNYDKVYCELKSGKRIFWYFEEDKKFFGDQGEDAESYTNDIFSGIIVGRQDAENNWGELDIEDCVIVMDQYPCEMCYPQYTWIALKRLLDDENLVKIFDKKKI